MFDRQNIPGWWYTYPSEKIWKSVSWEYDIPNWMESHKIPWFQTTNQYTSRTRKNIIFLLDSLNKNIKKKMDVLNIGVPIF